MPSPPAPTGKSSSRSSRIADPRRRLGLPPTAADPTAVAIAAVVGAHALRGLLRVRPYHWPSPSLTPGAVLALQLDGACYVAAIESVAPHGKGLLLMELRGVGDRTTAEGLRGAQFLVPAATLPPCAPGEFYWHEVVGWAVETIDGRALGTVHETMATGLNDVFCVRDANGREVLVPVIADVVRTIDRAARRIVVDPLPGLLDP